MATVTINATVNGIEIDENAHEYSLRANPNDPHVWVGSKTFSNVQAGNKYYTIRRKSDRLPVSSGSILVLVTTDMPYEETFNATESIFTRTISQSEHGKQKVKSVMVIDLDSQTTLLNNWTIYTNIDPPYSEGITINLEPFQRVLIRIA